ncbi:MAG: amidohydrolase [Tissierellia bacterium]|nr:amidohydrolase [Tissierellia bacterium]
MDTKKKESDSLPTILELRRHFHRFPEIGFEEIQTTQEILRLTEDLGCKQYYGKELYEEGPNPSLRHIQYIKEGYTGVLLEFEGEKPYILVRADIDGLPVPESESEDHFPHKEGFRSIHPNRMHACGHDGHISLGISLARHLHQNPPTRGVRIIFQPAEEGVQGAVALAPWIMKDVQQVLGFHIGLGQSPHTIGVGSTHFLAAKKLNLTFHGKSAHSANDPQSGICALSLATAFYPLAQQLTRDRSCLKMLNVGTIHGGTAKNALMESVTLGMDIRCTTDEGMEELFSGLKQIAQGVADSRKASHTMEIIGECTAYEEDNGPLVQSICDILEEKGLSTIPFPNFGASEDVTVFMKKARQQRGEALHLLLGTDLKGSHHAPDFDFPEEDLEFFLTSVLTVFQTMMQRR